METKLEIYEQDKYLKRGIWIWQDMFKELFASRELIWRLFLRDLLARYKQTVLSYLWILITPFIAIGTFVFLNSSGLINIGSTDVPYPLFALIGLSVWQLFSASLISGCNSLVSAGGMLSKVSFPREALVFSSLAQSLFEFLIKFCLIIIFFFIYRFKPHLAIILFPIAIIPIIILTLGLSLILSLVNGVFRDTANAVTLLTTFLMFLSPVLYPLPPEKLPFRLNLLAPLINAPRDVIVYGHIKEPQNFIIATAVSLLIFFISWRIFHLSETKIPERL
jgi:lipopolysaccharide transport system permease protein